MIDGMDFLRAFNEGTPLPLGKRVIGDRRRQRGIRRGRSRFPRAAGHGHRRAGGVRRGAFGTAHERR